MRWNSLASRNHNFTSDRAKLTVSLSISQTLNSISAEKNSTIIFPLPIDFISHFLNRGSKGGGGGQSGRSSPAARNKAAGTPPEIAVKED